MLVWCVFVWHEDGQHKMLVSIHKHQEDALEAYDDCREMDDKNRLFSVDPVSVKE